MLVLPITSNTTRYQLGSAYNPIDLTMEVDVHCNSCPAEVHWSQTYECSACHERACRDCVNFHHGWNECDQCMERRLQVPEDIDLNEDVVEGITCGQCYMESAWNLCQRCNMSLCDDCCITIYPGIGAPFYECSSHQHE